jgi:hypothetical protein
MIDETPERTRNYWLSQAPEYINALDNRAYQEEQRQRATRRDPNDNMKWRDKLNQLDPSHPRAPVPDWVRFAKREKQGFRCHILGWHELEWMFNKQSGEIQQVGMLTLDHTLAAANGGLTTDANTMMIAEIANSKKGSKMKTYDEMREFLFSIYELYVPTLDEIIAINSFRARGIKKVKL